MIFTAIREKEVGLEWEGEEQTDNFALLEGTTES